MKVVWILFKQNKLFNLLNIVASTIFFLMLLMLVINIDYSNIETDTARNFEDKNLYQVTDNLFNEKEADFFSRKDSYDILNEFANSLATSSKFTYYNATWQPIGVSVFKGDNVFDAYYEIGQDSVPYKINNKTYRAVKSVQLNNAVFDLNNIQLSSGRNFNSEEYTFHQKDNSVPVILGSEFSNLYKLGDTIQIHYYQKQLEGNIIGFLSSSQKIMTAKEPELILDKYIILPAMTFYELPSHILSNNPDNQLWVKASLLSRANGFIITELPPLEIRKVTDDIALKTGFSDFEIIGANSLAINSLIKITETNRTILLISAFLLFTINIVVFVFALSLKIKKNIDTFLVLLISGGNLNHIYKLVGLEFLLTSLIGCGLSIISLLILVNEPSGLFINYLFVIVASIFIMMIIINKFIKKTLNNIDMVQKLKG